MKITIDIPDEALYALLFHRQPAPVEPAKEDHWIIEDPSMRAQLRHYGFSCNPQHGRWYATRCPVPFNGCYRFPDGRVIESYGTELRWQRT